MTRSTSKKLWSRVCDLVLLADSNAGCTRVGLARKWNCTPRNVSYILTHARKMYGIEIECMQTSTQPSHYVLTNPGVLDLPMLRKWVRRGRR